jgi:glycerol-3-phosphate dehydrogenase (NAD(P)+)
VFVAVPPAWVRSLLKEAAEALRPEQELVHAVKGVEPGGATVSRVIEEESCVIRTGALAGPLVPEDLWRGEDGAAVLGSRFQSVLDAATAVLGGPHLRVYRTRDLRGVEIGGAMRTPVGLAAGMLRGAGAGKALLAVLLTRALAEAGRLATALGADRQTLSGLSGIGDWMLTAQEESDELLQAGMRVARGMPLGHDEAASRVRTLMELARERRVELPITGAVGAVLEGVPLREALGALMSRAARSEGE